MKEMLNESLPLLKQDLALKIIRGELSHLEIEKALNLFGMDTLTSKYYITYCIKISWNHIECHDVRKLKSSLLPHVFEEKGLGFVFLACFKENDILCIHTLSEYATGYSVTEHALIIRDTVSQLLEGICLVSVGVGSAVKSIHELKHSCETALNALRTVFFVGHGNILFYNEKNFNKFIFDKDMLTVFTNFLENAEEENAIKLLRNLESEIIACRNTTEIDSIKETFFKLYLSVIILAEKNALVFDKEGIDHFWKSVSEYETVAEFLSYLLQKVEKYVKVSDEKKNFGNRVREIMQYVNTHLSENELSVKNIASYMHFNTHYLCRYFRNCTGKTISEYILRIRMEKAKELLRDKEIKITHIAQQVGYINPSNFIKSFRKYSGCTPAEYRERR